MAKQKIIFDHSYFDKIDTPEKAYYFGFICADGTHNKYQFKIKIRAKDREILDKLKLSMMSDHIIYEYGEDVTFRICSKLLCDQLNKLGCPPKKSLILSYPKIINDFNKDFIRGVFDGDGWFSQNRWGIVSGSKKFLKKTSQIIKNEIGIQVKFYASNSFKRKNTLYSICVSNANDLMKLYHYLYDDVNLFLCRKYVSFSKRIAEIINIFNKRKIRLSVKKDRNNGMSYEDISKKYNITVKRAKRIVKYNYIPKS